MLSTHTTRNILLLTVLAFALGVNAENDPFLHGGGPQIHLTGAISGNTVTITWPKISGNWELMTQQPINTGDWQAIDTALYQTNSTSVSVTQPIPTQAAIYRLRRHFAKINIPTPPMPQIPTNRIDPRNLPPSPH